MNNQIKIFTNKDFGEVRTIIKDEEIWFVGKDVAEALGYSNTRDALVKHVDIEDKADVAIHDGRQNRSMIIINESGLYSLILSSKLPSAKKFKHWVTNEVLPSIRKTGSYKIEQKKDSEAELLNAKARVAELWIKLGDRTNIPEYRQITDSYASLALAGKPVLPLPEVKEKTYSAGEIGKILGVSANKIGRLANEFNLKTEKYGKYFYDKSQYSNKEVESFRYYNSTIDVFKELLA